jgi:type VI secretion system ImpM family protein
MPMSEGGAVGLYGKVVSQPDFLRVGAGAFCQAGLDRWLQEGVEALRAERTVLPSSPIAFLLAPTGAPTAFLGVLATSADAAGRSFPLSFFVEISTATARETLPSLPAAYAPFVGGASALLSDAPGLDGVEIAARAQALPVGGPAVAEPHAWKNEPVRALAASLGGSPAAIAYALRTLVAACERSGQSTATATAAGGLTVDAPTSGAATSALWLDLARRRLGWRDAVPSLFWTNGSEGAGGEGGSDGRLLMTLGPPSPLALAYLANPGHRSTRLWPLRTGVASAAEQALAALMPEQRRTIEDPAASLGDLAAAFAC